MLYEWLKTLLGYLDKGTSQVSTTDNPQVLALITKHEGCVLTVYKDQFGNDTIGVGHNLITPLPLGWSSPITPAQAQQLLAIDVSKVWNELNSALSWFAELDSDDPERSAVLQDMAFNMGVADFLTFKTFLSLVSAGEYAQAATDMMNTLWARQVPTRATEDSCIMANGVWPEGI
jgi:lysozyme